MTHRMKEINVGFVLGFLKFVKMNMHRTLRKFNCNSNIENHKQRTFVQKILSRDF